MDHTGQLHVPVDRSPSGETDYGYWMLRGLNKADVLARGVLAINPQAATLASHAAWPFHAIFHFPPFPFASGVSRAWMGIAAAGLSALPFAARA